MSKADSIYRTTTYLVVDTGRFAVCGNNSKGQLGVEPSVKKVLSFTEMQLSDLSSPATDVSCGWEHTLITTTSGHVYGLGCNGYGQLAIDGQLAASSKPVLIPDLQNIAKTACGLRHSMALSRDGKVLCWGEGRRGQLGRKTGDKWRISAVEDIPEPVVDIAAGQHHSAALTTSGAVYVWGCNKHGQLGVDPDKMLSSYTPMKILGLPEVRRSDFRFGAKFKFWLLGHYRDTLRMVSSGRVYSGWSTIRVGKIELRSTRCFTINVPEFRTLASSDTVGRFSLLHSGISTSSRMWIGTQFGFGSY